MAKDLWKSPYYNLKDNTGTRRIIDVTSSIGFNLGPKSVFYDEIIPFFQRKGVKSILDFGAGALRHTFPFIDEGYTVCSVEFKEAFDRPVAKTALEKAKENPNFSALIWPNEFRVDKRKFDAAILSYVIQTMPKPVEREAVIREIFRKLKRVSYLIYLSRYGEARNLPESQRVSDGYFMNPKRSVHSFYRDFTSEETHELFKKHKLEHIRSLSKGGSEQVFIYMKGNGGWI